MRPYRSVIIVPLLVLFSAAAWAETISLPLTDDVRINANKPTSNFGSYDMLVHDYGPKYSLVRFDAASISGQSVSSAVLELYLSSIRQDGTISLHAITSSWSEATVTWDTQPPAEAAVAAVANLSTGDVGGTVAIDVTATVQRWADGSLADAGFLIVTNDDIKAYFDVKEMPAGTPATLTVDTGPLPYNGEATVLDLSDPDGCTIDEPGYYVLDRSWLLTPDDEYEPNANEACSISGLHIVASAILDMRGFLIDGGAEWPKFLGIINVESGIATIRDGSLKGFQVAIEGTSAARVRLERIRTVGSVDLQENSYVLNSEISGFDGNYDAALQVSSNSTVVDTVIIGPNPCLKAYGSSVVVRNNIMKGCGVGSAVYIFSSDSIFEGNYVSSPYLEIFGDRNIVSRNIIYRYLTVSGTENILDANLVQSENLVFYEKGNYFGNNRVAGVISHPEGQVDWGGNVSF
jgi:hypothetical protein